MRFDLALIQRATLAAALLGLFSACSDDPDFFFDPDAVTLPDSSDTVVPDVDDSDAGEDATPDIADPDVPDAVDPDVIDPDVADPDATDTIDPDVTDPDAVDPDVTDPDVTDPDVVDPDVVDPDAGDTIDPDTGDTTDPCATGDICAAVGVSCDVDELVTCVPDADGCLRPFRTDCTATPFGFCESLGAVAQCSVADPCEGLDLCPDAARTCDGETLVVCAPNENGCLLEERTACDGELRGFCDDSGDVMCDVAPDPCEDLELCTTAGVTCVDDVRESCTMNAFGCMVIERIDCGASDQVCEVDTCQSRCGDGVVDADEDCDDGNREGADGCSIMCEVELGWRCDDGEPTVCEETRCGDSILDPGEFCDDGGTRSGDGCGATCQIETGYTCVGEPSICTLDPFCGDGTIDAGEVCDDGDRFSNDGCSAACRVETGYSCVGAPSVCTLDPFCGDGTIDAGEVCDDGDRFSNDGCSAACRVETGYTCVGAPSVCTLDPFCGDGSIDAGEDCDDGDRFSNDGCSSSCEVESGYVCSDEPSICVIPPNSCGNGTVDRDEFEGCDDGNRVSGDGCSADCGLELPTSRASAVSFAFSITSASPTYVRQTAGCSSPSTTTETYPYTAIRVTNSSSVARSYSFGATYTLDGFLLTYAPDFDPSNPTASCLVGDDDFSYNDGPGTGGSYLEELSIEAGASVIVLLTTFSAAPTLPFTGQLNMYWSGCGDGAVGTGETCDDADVFGGDGCSSTCQEEAGFDCDGESPTLCTERVCGDGVVQGEDGEACDDGNNSPNDGCNNCQVEAGWLCEPFSEPSDCRFIACGDGFIDGDEECDDDNIASDDGCSSACELEDGFFCLADSEPTECRVLECGDGSIDYDAGERCDDGNGEAGDGCGETCRVETGFRCEGLPSVCVDETNACGDGVLAPGEGCDGNDYTPEEACNVDCVLSLPANGDTLTLMGSIDDDDGLYAAPAADCGAQSGDFFYDAYTFRNDTGDLLELDIVATLADDVDVSLRLFTSTLNLAAPGATCLAGDDDFGFLGTEAVLNDRIIGAGATIVVAVSGAEPLDSIGEYTLGIVAAGCGDGEINAGEECDDADGVDGDGCSSTCEIEDGFTCSGEPSLCDGDICGDGSFDAGEACDDGNFVVGDGCSPSCTIEDGFLCDSEFPTTCEPGECGDGVRSELAAEGCDDANTVANDGCSDTCELESGGACNNAEPQTCVLPVCGDGVMEAWETCDVPDGGLCQGCATPLDLFGDAFSLEGSIDDTDLVFRRPVASSGPCTSADTREISYFDGWSYMNNTSVSETINVRAEWDDGDGYLLIFGDDFDPQSPFDSCLWGDDDDGGTSASELDYTLAPGESVVIIATTFNNDAPIGTYTITVDFP